jgi:hypothetical protein
MSQREAIEMAIRAIEQDGPEEMIRFVRGHENYPKVLRNAAEMRRDLKRLHVDREHREKLQVIVRLMEKPPEQMTPRELAWLVNFVVGPSSLFE